ncbi:MAG: DUF6273 domain-containing protein [Bacilli bacterium]|nr:DUF6273 domain-containing protein [Bacilli bacterium]
MKKIFICSPILALGLMFSCKTNPTVEPDSFAFDSWATLRNVANQGLDHLKEIYKPIGNTFIIQDLSNIIEVEAKSRQIYIEGVGKFTVRVIGENHDTDSSGKVIPLTFEMTSVLKEVPYSPSTIQSNKWETSELRRFLNVILTNWVGSDLAGNIVPAMKTTRVGDGDNSFKDNPESFFPLSPIECGIDYKETADGKLYEFYKKHKDETTGSGTTDDPTHNIWEKGNTSYWLRAPLKDTTLNSCIVRDHDEKKTTYSIFYIEDVCKTLAVAPCFCI